MDIFCQLTDREFEVLHLITEGLSNNEIAKKLSITIHTVKAHIASIYFKTNINSRVLIAVKAIKSGIIFPEYRI